MKDKGKPGQRLAAAESGSEEEKLFPAVDNTTAPVLVADDDLFIKRIFETDPRKAFELLYNKYYSLLCNHAVRFVFSRQKAEDLVADVFVLFWNNRLYVSVTSSFRAYLFTAVRNKCCTYLKWDLKKEGSGELTDTAASTNPTPEEIMYASDLHIKIEQIIQALPGRQQQVFVLSRFEGKKNREIAKALKLSVKTVEMHVSKTLATFRKMLDNEL